MDPSSWNRPTGPPCSCPGLLGSCPTAACKCLLGEPGNRTAICRPLTPPFEMSWHRQVSLGAVGAPDQALSFMFLAYCFVQEEYSPRLEK